LTAFLLVVFTACWITHATRLPSRSACEALRPALLRALATLEPLVLFTADCYPAGTDLEALERERLETLACIWPPNTEVESRSSAPRGR